MTFTLCFWRALKSPRAKVLLNLCVAIAITCALAIFEGLARKKVCIPVYALKLFFFYVSLVRLKGMWQFFFPSSSPADLNSGPTARKSYVTV